MSIKTYYELVKPGMVYGNAFTTLGGFLLATHDAVDGWLLVATIAGISLVIASACVFNNIIDQRRDALMARTKNRSLATGEISNKKASLYGAALGVIGFLLLIGFTNVWAVAAAAIGFFFYVFMYSMWFKPHSRWGALVGSASGAVPPVVGYASASGRFDVAA
ncbi:MAG: UbiA family prenyltransferase, partial [Candidatus Saccharimonadales bacterium]